MPPRKKSAVAVKLAAAKAAAPVATDDAPHIIVEALAGTGKTTTLVEGLKRVKGEASTLVPSPQQAAVWNAMSASAAARSICFVAFNKSIATELQARVPAGCDAMTMHAMGYRAVTTMFGRQEPTSYATQNIICDLCGWDSYDRQRPAKQLAILKGTEELVGLAKQNLTGFGAGPDFDWVDALDALSGHYDVELNGVRADVYDLVPRVLERTKQPKGKITFDDMVWLPVVLDLPLTRYDLLLVDEAQDLNRCQQQLALKAGSRLILCGDANQAIYGFAGADSESLKRMAVTLGETTRGCVRLPLTVTRRCGRSIVNEARKYVDNFEAHESNGDGRVYEATFEGAGRYAGIATDGDMVLCRVNAPLVSQCFRFLKEGRKAQIQGRDVGAGLIKTINKLEKASKLPDYGVTQLVADLSDWLHLEEEKENAKRNPSEQRLIGLRDRHDCLLCFIDGAKTVAEVTDKIGRVFTDNKQSPGIKLSSIHKAKGLESRRVFFLQPKGGECPHPMAKSAWQKEQEVHLLYVGITRAIEELVFVYPAN